MSFASMQKVFPRARVMNVYGLTEIGAIASSRSLATIGAPITDDIQIRIQGISEVRQSIFKQSYVGICYNFSRGLKTPVHFSIRHFV